MKPPYTVFVAAPRILSDADAKPRGAVPWTLEELCDAAEIPCRVTGAARTRVLIYVGGTHFWASGGRLYVAVAKGWRATRVGALRVLEVLAHGFHDYAARECICGQNLFSVPQLRGRPSVYGRPMTAAERMRRSRQKKQQRFDRAVENGVEYDLYKNYRR